MYTFEFKLVCASDDNLIYTNEKVNLYFDPILSIHQFVINASCKITEIYSNLNMVTLEIVEAGQFNNENGYDPGLAHCLRYSRDTLKERYGNTWKNTAFYARYRKKEEGIQLGDERIRLGGTGGSL